MAFGFPAHHEEDLSIPEAMGEDGLLAVLSELGWTGSATGDRRGWRGATGVGWGRETIDIEWISESAVRVRSECARPIQCFDGGRNRRNVERLRAALAFGSKPIETYWFVEAAPPPSAGLVDDWLALVQQVGKIRWLDRPGITEAPDLARFTRKIVHTDVVGRRRASLGFYDRFGEHFAGISVGRVLDPPGDPTRGRDRAAVQVRTTWSLRVSPERLAQIGASAFEALVKRWIEACDADYGHCGTTDRRHIIEWQEREKGYRPFPHQFSFVHWLHFMKPQEVSLVISEQDLLATPACAVERLPSGQIYLRAHQDPLRYAESDQLEQIAGVGDYWMGKFEGFVDRLRAARAPDPAGPYRAPAQAAPPRKTRRRHR